MHSIKSAWKIVPQFLSQPIDRTVHFYTKNLGLRAGGIHTLEGSLETTFCSLLVGKKAEAKIYFRTCDPGHLQPREALVAMGTKESDKFHELMKSQKSLDIFEALKDKP
ncbi:hypothetical protein BDZ45DRAFT_674559 [Acephala macrosclerotiorum]|nr:hypothetical protein BDZ45DRAFT_674559 [Acephala macrosclerotiorum]